MYFIVSKNNTKAFYLFENQEYIVGRKDCNILIENDTSISRIHASLTIKNGKLGLTDLGAKYKTFVNNIQLQPKVLTELNINDEIKFGILNSIYRVKKENLTVTTSGLTPEDKKVLSKVMKKLGGNMLPNWSKECSYLIVREIMLTLKVLCAFIEKQPIIKLKFWTDYVKHVNENLPPPNPLHYKATYAENIINKNIDFREECSRKKLFKDKVFIFKNKASKAKIEAVVELAGGTSFSWNEKPLVEDHFSSNNPQYLLIQDDTNNSDNSDCFMKMINYLHSIGKRSIPFQEIAMAIVLGTCEKDCNPDFDRTGILIKEKEQIIFTSDILAFETQTQDDIMDIKSSVVVPETLGNRLVQDELSGNKNVEACSSRNKREAQELENDHKRIRLENNEGKETYSNVFGKQQQNNVVTSTQKDNSEIKSFDFTLPTLKNTGEFNGIKNGLDNTTVDHANNNLKRMQQRVNSNEKRIRLEHSDKDDGWVTVVKHKTNECERSVSMDVTREEKEVTTSTQKEKTFTKKLDQVQKSANPFGFVRCLEKSTTTTKIPDFFKSTSTSDRNVADISVIDLDLPSTRGKRKSSDDTSPNKAKRQQLLMNPFSKEKESTIIDKPFQRRTCSIEGALKNNPFNLSSRKVDSKKAESTKLVEKETFIPYVFNVTIVDTEMENNHGWLSKSNITKHEPDSSSKSLTNFDEGLQKFMESFNNCVVVEELPLVVPRPSIIEDTQVTMNGRKNIKKFKKVQPLHIQTTIIPRTSYVESMNTEIEVN